MSGVSTEQRRGSMVELSSVRVNTPLAAVNRLLATVHLVLGTAAIARRALPLLVPDLDGGVSLVHAAMVAADLTLLFIWVLSQAAMWRPVTRTAFPDRLRRSDLPLPGLDVLVVTADPDKEPTVAVMNTVLSAMALDYPGGRLSVYLSDDAGSAATLLAARKAYGFARTWVPFCNRYKVECPCPSTYFSNSGYCHRGQGIPVPEEQGIPVPEEERTRVNSGYCHREPGIPVPEEEWTRVKKLYEAFTEDLKRQSQSQSAEAAAGTGTGSGSRDDHDAHVEIIIISEDEQEQGQEQDEEIMVPMLVYVSREKRRTSPHHFKAGALNVLLRVSGLLSDSPYLLVLDCDMTCNSRSSAIEAMCFHLDDSINLNLRRNERKHRDPQLAFVQFPQMFHNLSSHDIYANELRAIFSTRWKGLDGLRGPILSGTGFYMRREALYLHASNLPCSGSSNLPCSDSSNLPCSDSNNNKDFHRRRQQLLEVASCSYEEEEEEKEKAKEEEEEEEEEKMKKGWGHKVGFLYESVVEDYFTGYRQLFCRGWTSVYCYPDNDNDNPPFLGTVPTNLNDVLVQNKRWMSGLLAVGLSRRHCPLINPESLAVSVLQSMSFAYYGLVSLSALPVLCYALLTPLCFLRGVPLFFSFPFFVSSLLQHLIEVSVAKRRLALRTWWNEQRFWMLNAVTAQLFACLTVFLGRNIDFEVTSKKASDKLYQDGVFDFTGCSALLLPATTLSVLNVAALVAGTLYRRTSSFVLMGGEFLLMCYAAALSFPLLEGMFLRQDAARVPRRITALSVALAAALFAMFG